MSNTSVIPKKSSGEVNEKLAQLRWTGFIIAFFVIQAILWAVAITLTSTDPSHAILPNYDRQAVEWDKHRATQLASDRLGWKVEILIDSAADFRGYRSLTITVADQQQRPVEGLSIDIEAFHRGRAAETKRLLPNSVGPGVYNCRLKVSHGGIWQFRGTLQRDQETFLLDTRLNIEKIKAPVPKL